MFGPHSTPHDTSGNKSEAGMAEFVRNIVPSDGDINFIFEADFAGTGEKQAVVGYSLLGDRWLHQVVLYIYVLQGEYKYLQFFTSAPGTPNEGLGSCDNAYIADTTGDRHPDLILALARGNGHIVTIVVFNWVNGFPNLLWISPESFDHGMVYVLDDNNDGVYDIAAIFSIEVESLVFEVQHGLHITESVTYKYDGSTYIPSRYPVPLYDQPYNTAVMFLRALGYKNYMSAYRMVMLPSFLGLDGLDDSSFNTFKRYISTEVMPLLERNINGGYQLRANEFGTAFFGRFNTFIIDTARNSEEVKVTAVKIIEATYKDS